VADEPSTAPSHAAAPSGRERRRTDHAGRRAIGSRIGLRRLTGGGTDGNERLTTVTGLFLIALLAVLGVTIVFIGRLLWLHMFLGLLLIGPVVLKLMSTGYRFFRYYTSDPDYRRKGPPATVLRFLGPVVVLSTVAVFGTGVALLALGPSSRQPLGELHKLSFFAWIAVVVLHVLGHLREIVAYLQRAAITRRQLRLEPVDPDGAGLPGAAGRVASLALAVGGGGVLAVALIPLFAGWTH
jgi:hypothetical protein